MATEFRLPELGENIESADIVKIFVSVDDQIEVDQPILEIETDKATIEVPSSYSGKVQSIYVKEGDEARVDQLILTVEEKGTEETALAEERDQTKPEEMEKETKAEKTSPPPSTTQEKAPKERGSKAAVRQEFRLPELGEDIETADVAHVLVAAGDEIKQDQPVIEIETDKATIEVPSPANGVVKDVHVKEGDTVKIGQLILILETKVDLEKLSSRPKQEEQQKDVNRQEKDVTPSSDVSTKKKTPSSSRKLAPAAPSTRGFARQIGVDINEVHGTGPGGRISIQDVKNYAKQLNQEFKKVKEKGVMPGVMAEPLPDFSKWGEVKREKMNNVRRKTAAHLSFAWTTIPHVTQFDKADVTKLDELRKQYGKRAEAAGGKLTVTAILLKVIASALKTFPKFNASIDMANEEIIHKKYYHLGVAVDTDRGLLVPVIRNVDQKNIIELSVELTEVSQKARERKLGLEEMQGGTFTISNLGGIGGTYFAPIVNPPEVAILGVSRSAIESIYIDGQFEPRLIMPLSLSYDHRLIDGADAARFLRWIVEALEQPFLLALEG